MRRLPRQHRPAGIERDYARELRKIGRRTAKELQPLMRELPSLLASARTERLKESGKLDMGESRRVRLLLEQAGQRAQISTAALEALATKFAVRIQTHQRVQMSRQVKAVLGVDLSSNIPLRASMDAFVTENVSLIKDVSAKVYRDVEGIVNRGVSSGALHKDIAKEIQAATNLGTRRSAVIARDQVGKYYGQVQATRHKAIGVKRFTWSTVEDERVRSEHASLNGEVFEYDKPPSEGLPGEPIMCRCYADPVLDDLL